MPNGGPDCCGTCWFNARNLLDDPGPNFCTIRGLAIDLPFWTYCGNHTHKRPEKDPVPIGPAFVADVEASEFGHYPRKVLQPSPDAEDIRLHLLELLRGIPNGPTEGSEASTPTDELVVWQV